MGKRPDAEARLRERPGRRHGRLRREGTWRSPRGRVPAARLWRHGGGGDAGTYLGGAGGGGPGCGAGAAPRGPLVGEGGMGKPRPTVPAGRRAGPGPRRGAVFSTRPGCPCERLAAPGGPPLAAWREEMLLPWARAAAGARPPAAGSRGSPGDGSSFCPADAVASLGTARENGLLRAEGLRANLLLAGVNPDRYVSGAELTDGSLKTYFQASSSRTAPSFCCFLPLRAFLCSDLVFLFS